MNIQETKVLINKMYCDSLNFKCKDPVYHPIRIIESCKSIIGINPEKPIDKLIDYCQEQKWHFEDYSQTVLYCIWLASVTDGIESA